MSAGVASRRKGKVLIIFPVDGTPPQQTYLPQAYLLAVIEVSTSL
jgi:hypothetical protein